MINPKITVLMPVYNVALYVRAAIESILNQSYTDFELLIINDGSTDTTRDEVLKIQDSRIRFIENEKNIGLANTLNKGIELAKGEYIARMDGDDISVLNRLEKQLRILEDNPEIDICGTAYEFFGSRNYAVVYPERNDDIRVGLLFGCCMIIPMFRRKSILDANLRYNQIYFPAEDYRFWTECMLAGLKMYNVQEILFKYRMHPTQVSEVMTNQKDMTLIVKSEYIIRLFNNWDQTNVEVLKNVFVFRAEIKSINELRELKEKTDSIIQQNKYQNTVNHKALNTKIKSLISSESAIFVNRFWFKERYYLQGLFKLILNRLFFELNPKFRLKLILKCIVHKTNNSL